MSIFIGCDPGTSNSAISVIECSNLDSKNKLDIKLLEISMLLTTIVNLTDTPAKLPKSKRRKNNKDERIPVLKDQFTEHYKTWEDIFDTYKPIKKVSVERFQTRGPKGSTIEAVTLMNGSVASICYQRKVEYSNYIAGTWKNSLNKYLKKFPIKGLKIEKDQKPLEAIYKLNPKLPNHIIDSVFIGIYGLLTFVNKTWEVIKIHDIIKQLSEHEFVK